MTSAKQGSVHPLADDSAYESIYICDKSNRNIHYLASRRPLAESKPVVLVIFVHGVGSNSKMWTPYLAKLSSSGIATRGNCTLRAVAPDMFGHGRSADSTLPADYHFSLLCSDLTLIFDKESADAKGVILVGHSYGCSICSHLAGQRASKILGMCFISPPAPVPLKPRDQILKLPTCCITMLFPCFKLAFRRDAFSEPTCCPRINEEMAFDVTPHVFQQVMLGQEWPDGDPSFFGNLGRNCNKSIVVHGENDRLVPLVEAAMTGQQLGATFKVIKSAGHFVPIEAFDDLYPILIEFITSVIP